MFDLSGYRQPQTDLGTALRMAFWSYVIRVDKEMEDAGFAERTHSTNYIFALYAHSGPMTISDMGRLFDVSRQAASKIVAELRNRGFVEAIPSLTDQREKVVQLTPQAMEYMDARLQLAASLDDTVRKRIGDNSFDRLKKGLRGVFEVSAGPASFDNANLYRSPKLWWP